MARLCMIKALHIQCYGIRGFCANQVVVWYNSLVFFVALICISCITCHRSWSHFFWICWQLYLEWMSQWEPILWISFLTNFSLYYLNLSLFQQLLSQLYILLSTINFSLERERTGRERRNIFIFQTDGDSAFI